MKKLRITVDGKSYDVEVEVLSSRISSVAPAAPAPKAEAGDVACPLAATIVNVAVKEGQQVNAGDLLVMLEAMKMNTPVNAVKDGTVAKVYVAAGQSVQEGQPLVALS